MQGWRCVVPGLLPFDPRAAWLALIEAWLALPPQDTPAGVCLSAGFLGLGALLWLLGC